MKSLPYVKLLKKSLPKAFTENSFIHADAADATDMMENAVAAVTDIAEKDMRVDVTADATRS